MPAWYKCHCSTSLVTYFVSISAGLCLVLILCITRIQSWMRCWMNMYLSSMCLPLLETPMRAGRAVRVYLEIDFACKNFSMEILEV